MNAGQRASAEDGLSLIELLIAILVLGIGVTSIVLALGTAINTSRTTRNQASGETVVRRVTEVLKEASLEPAYAAASCPDIEALVDGITVTGWDIALDGDPEYWLPLTSTWGDRSLCQQQYRDDLCAFEGQPGDFTTCDDARTVGGWQRVPVAIAVDSGDPADSAAIDHNTVVYLRRSVES